MRSRSGSFRASHFPYSLLPAPCSLKSQKTIAIKQHKTLNGSKPSRIW
ncbi:MAG: hypothetical protein F6J98_31790 [Moorea sp. SIO4G2]|nr:hypothetical protein [Moorena sp. SIO4G2]